MYARGQACCGFQCCSLQSPFLFFSPLGFLALAEQGLDTLTVCWHSALNMTFFRVPERLFVPVAVSHSPQLVNLYLQSPMSFFQLQGILHSIFLVLPLQV